jgi:hypothetical protein
LIVSEHTGFAFLRALGAVRRGVDLLVTERRPRIHRSDAGEQEDQRKAGAIIQEAMVKAKRRQCGYEREQGLQPRAGDAPRIIEQIGLTELERGAGAEARK